jgi:hypothetical protein
MKIVKSLLLPVLPMVMLAACSEKPSENNGPKDTGTFEKAYLRSGQEIEESHTSTFLLMLYNGEFTLGEMPKAPYDGLWVYLLSDSSESTPADGIYEAGNTVANGTLLVGSQDWESTYWVERDTEPILTDIVDGAVKLSHKGETFTVEFDVLLKDGETIEGIYVGSLQREDSEK